MSVNLTSNMTERFYFWTAFKALITTKNLSLQYDNDDAVLYVIWGYDGPEIYVCKIWKSAVPASVVLGGYTQEQNDADKADFEASYQSMANTPIFYNMQFQNKFSNITGNTTQTVKGAPGILHSIMLNNNTTGGTVTLYDNTSGSGTKIATLHIGTPSGGVLSSSGEPGPLLIGPMGVVFMTGLTVVSAGSTSNDITVCYQ